MSAMTPMTPEELRVSVGGMPDPSPHDLATSLMVLCAMLARVETRLEAVEAKAAYREGGGGCAT